MTTTQELIKRLDQLNATPHDLAVRGRVEEALRDCDVDALADVMNEFRVELPTAEAVERRLVELGSTDDRVMARIARTLSMYSDTEERWQHAVGVVSRALEINQNNTEALDTVILLYAFRSDAPRDKMIEWSERYTNLEPHNIRAISGRAKVLLKFGRADDATSYLRETAASLERDSAGEVVQSVRELLKQINARQNVLHQWP
jgi:hypothetical protein